MPRLPLLDDQTASPEVRRVFAEFRRTFGALPKSARTIAHHPRILEVLIPFAAVVQGEAEGSQLSARLKELAVLKTTMINQCAY